VTHFFNDGRHAISKDLKEGELVRGKVKKAAETATGAKPSASSGASRRHESASLLAASALGPTPHD
jgi:hypothetical protein